MNEIVPKRHVILFSGGFDSTFTLVNIVDTINRTIEAHDEIGGLCRTAIWNGIVIQSCDEVVALSISNNLCGTTAKYTKETEARKTILRLIVDMYPKVPIKGMTIGVDIFENYGKDDSIHMGNQPGLFQPLIWALSAIPWMHKGDIIYFSYINNDQAPIYFNEIEMVLQCGSRIMGVDTGIRVEFPLRLAKKPTILFELYNFRKSNTPDSKGFGKKLFEACVSCEGYFYDKDNKFCGNCKPCEHLISALFDLFYNGNNDEVDFAIHYLAEWFPGRLLSVTERVKSYEDYLANVRKEHDNREKERDKKDTSESCEIYTEKGCDDSSD